MRSHRFRIGDRARLVWASSANNVEEFIDLVTTIDAVQTAQVWEMTQLLPADRSGFQYNIGGSRDGLECLCIRASSFQPQASWVPSWCNRHNLKTVCGKDLVSRRKFYSAEVSPWLQVDPLNQPGPILPS